MRLADLAESSGADLGYSTWLDMGQDRINTFAEATEDRQWIHIDPARAGSGPFGGTIAHGYLTLSLVSSFLFELLHVEDAASIVNYGLDRLRFPSPVPVGSSVRAHGQLIEVKPVAGGVQTTVRFTVETKGGTKPAAVADVLTRYLA